MRLTPLEPDNGCCNRLNWRCDLEGAVPAERLAERLIADGFRVAAQHPALRLFRHPAGHEVAWVVATGRMQIRVDLAVPADRRPAVAAGLHRSLALAVDATFGAAEENDRNEELVDGR